MALSEIEKLERRFHENPQGLTFAPLAEAYRKSGDPQRAIGVLTPGLELHPDYIPASIVLGRCHLDLKDDGAAESAFMHVLELDTENVIALKALADITERSDRFGEAAQWLEQLLTVDRSNDEAREQLERVRASDAQQPVVDSGVAAPGAAEAEEGGTAVAALDGLESHMLEMPADDAFGEELPPLATVERETIGAAAVESPPVEAFEATVAATPEPLPVTDPNAVVLDDAILGVMQLGNAEEIVLSPAEHTEFQLPSSSEGFGADAVTDDTPATSSEYQLPSASDDRDTAPSVDAANGAAEYQLPSASDELIPESEAATGASEFQLPDASSTFDGNALAMSDMSSDANEYQSSPVAADLLAQSQEPSVASSSDATPPPAAVSELDADDAAEPGEWVTWSDAALDADAEPFDSEPLEAASPTSLAITEIMEILQLSGGPTETVIDTSTFREESTTVVDIGEITETMEVPELIDATDATETAGIEEPDLVVTESMAELFLKQGHPADALRIYRELLLRRPEDARLADRVASLEGSEAARSEPLPRYAASASGGTSVRELMRTVLGSRPGGIEAMRPAAETAATGSGAPGTPTRPAADHLTLSAIFGEDAAPLPPMSRKPRAASPPPSERGGVSFDEFYGGGGNQPGTTPRPAGALPSAGGEDDLDQFHDWLQNLKR